MAYGIFLVLFHLDIMKMTQCNRLYYVKVERWLLSIYIYVYIESLVVFSNAKLISRFIISSKEILIELKKELDRTLTLFYKEIPLLMQFGKYKKKLDPF